MPFGMGGSMDIKVTDNQFGLILLYKFVKIAYLMAGLYWFYPEVLNMLFWPFYYGWFAH